MSSTVYGQSYTKDKRVERSFPLLDDTEIEVINKYGDITIENWDQDSVKIIVECKVTSNKEAKLNKTYEAISFDFKANEYYVLASTEFVGSGSFWSDVSDIASNLFSGGTNTSIDYIIYVPDDIKLKLELKYGNIYMANHSGDIKINLSNGNLKAHSLTGNTNMEVVFSDLTINKITSGDIKINYGSLILEYADNLKISGQSSEYEIYEVKKLLVDSKRDKIAIDDVESLSGESYFSHVVIDNLFGEVDLKTKYGSFKIKEIKENTKSIALNNSNTTVNINLDSNNSYNIDITSDEKAEITYSTGLGDFNTKELGDKDKLLQARCLYGNMRDAVDIKIDIRSGLLSLKLQK